MQAVNHYIDSSYLDHSMQSTYQCAGSSAQHDTHREYDHPKGAVNISSSAQDGGRSSCCETAS